MEGKERISQMPETTKDAVARYFDGDSNAALSYIRKHPDQLGEFCTQLRFKYPEDDDEAARYRIEQILKALQKPE